MAVVRLLQRGIVRTDNGVVSKRAQRESGIGGRQEAIAPITGAVAAGNRQDVGDVGDKYHHSHQHIQEVISDNNGNRGFPAITGRLIQPATRR